MQRKKQIISTLVASFLLVGCSTGLSSLTNEEKTLHDTNIAAANDSMHLAEMLNEDADTMPSYETVWNSSRETGQKLKKALTAIEKLSLPEETAQVLENTDVTLQSTLRIVEKVEEISAEARALLIEEDSALTAEQRDARLSEINTTLYGFRGRLEKSKEKFENLNEQLLELSATNNE